MKNRTASLIALAALGLLVATAAAEPAQLARDGQALMSVVHAPKASDNVKKDAADLAAYLGKITGAKFTVAPGDGTSGIVVGLATDFPALGLVDRLKVKDVQGREAYVLRSSRTSLQVIGATEVAVEHAVWDLLWRIGYRQFFPGPTWEVIPSIRNLKVDVSIAERPDYYARRIWYGYGAWPCNAGPYRTWCARNRGDSGFRLNTGHAYEGIIHANEAAFEEHPEWRGLLDGKRKSSKLCIGNPELRKFVCDYAVKYFEKHPDADSISVDPSDGGGWCECEQCKALGSISDRALTLANQVAQTLGKRWPRKFVGMYAYNQHSPPPSIPVHPNVIISVASGFIKGGYTFDQLMNGWFKQGATLGVRDYFDVNVWSRDLPGHARAANLAYIRTAIPKAYAKGARYYSAESGDCWGPCGLGYYLAARIFWDVKEADRVDELVDDFLTRAFGPAKTPMTAFYTLIDGENKPLLCEDLLGRMYRLLARARKLADTPQVRARIDALVLYTHYVELFRDYAAVRGEERQKRFEALIKFSWRIRKTMMTHSLALYRDLDGRDGQVFIPKEAGWQVPENPDLWKEKKKLTLEDLERQAAGPGPDAKDPTASVDALAAGERGQYKPQAKPPEGNIWKSSKPFSRAELDGYVAAGVARYKVVDIKPVAFGTDLVPATPLGLPRSDSVGLPNGWFGRGTITFYTWIADPATPLQLRVTGGLIAHYRDRGNVRIDLIRLDGTREERVAHAESPPDGVERTLQLKATHAGLHQMIVRDGSDKTRVVWPNGTPMVIRSTLEAPTTPACRWDLYFYVPKRTIRFALFGGGAGTIVNADGKVVYDFAGRPTGYHVIPVAEGQAGRLWMFKDTAGRRRLLTIPPFLARSASEMLLPRKLVE